MTELTILLVTAFAFAALGSAQPHLTRPELFFAVTVTEQFRHTSKARGILLQYHAFGWFATAVITALAITGWAIPASIVGLIVAAWVLAFFLARHKVLPHRTSPTTVREAGLRARPERIRGGIATLLGPFVILAAKTAYVRSRWDLIPERFPVHWGLNGPDRWVDRTPLSVYGSLASIAFICAVMIGIAYATLHASRRVSASGPADESERKFRQISVMGLIALAYVFAIVLPPISGGTPDIPYAPFLILGVAVVFVGLLIRTGQGGTRLRGAPSILSDSSPTGDRTPDDCWKLGMIYYNPADPALVIEKRFGIGWTLNFANRWAWVMTAAVVCFPILIRYVTT